MMKTEGSQEEWRQPVGMNNAQLSLILLPALNVYAILSRATGKSYIMGAAIDELVRSMPRGITSVTQSTMLQALTKTLPSAFKMLEVLGYKRYDNKTKTGDYVIRRQPPDHFYRPYEHILNYEYSITFSNGHMLYLFSQDGNSRGPSVDFNISDEALTLDKEKFDRESAPTNRGNEGVFGHLSDKPVAKHHGNLFLSSMPWEASGKWLLEPAAYYKQEKGIELFQTWNKIVSLQMQLISFYMSKDRASFLDCWNECVRLRSLITPFVSENNTLFMLSNVFDNIANVGMKYIVQQYLTMDKLSFMVEVLNYVVEVVDDCYYKLEERHVYHNAIDSSFVLDFAENTDFNFDQLASFNDCRQDLDVQSTRPLSACVDWGATYSFMIVAQERAFDFTSRELTSVPLDNIVNCFYLERDEVKDVLVVELANAFASYYAMHANRNLILYADRHGDARSAASKKTYNEQFISQLERQGWKVDVKRHGGQEPPQHDKFLLSSMILAETKRDKFPALRINGDKCKALIGSMNNTKVVMDSSSKFKKDKSSEKNRNLPQEQATHFGDCLDKYLWTKYGHLLKSKHSFVSARI